MKPDLQNNHYEIIIVGAGPAGLASAIFSARKGKKVLLIEKCSKIGPEPRGETLHNDSILSELLGDGVMESLTLSNTAVRIFYSPDTSIATTLSRKTPSIVFDWEEWMKAFNNSMKGFDIELKLNSEVTDLIINDNIANGIIYNDQNGIAQNAFGKAIFACDGHRSIIGKKLGIDYDKQNSPIIKCLMKNGNFQGNGFRLWMIPSGSLEFALDFPPAVIFLFPRDGNNLETGILIFTNYINELGISSPSTQRIFQIWKEVKEKYPVFSQMVKNSTSTYEKLTGIPMTGPVDNFIPLKGVVLVGDSAGFVEASGGSGLVSSIKSAKIWSELICNAMDRFKSPETLWSQNNVDGFKKIFNESKINKHIKKVAKVNNIFRRIVFVKWRTKDKIIKRWWIIKMLMRLA